MPIHGVCISIVARAHLCVRCVFASTLGTPHKREPHRFEVEDLARAMDSVVVRDPAIMSGEPTFRGTRVLVRTLFDYFEAGHSLERFLEGFPTVTRAMALQALEEAKESLLASR